MKARYALGIVYGLMLTIPAFADGTRWFETEGIRSAVVDENLCRGIQTKFSGSVPWTMKRNPGQDYYGEMSESVAHSPEEKTAHVMETYTLKEDDTKFMSRFLSGGQLQIPWYVDAVTALPQTPIAISGAVTLAAIMQKLATPPAGIADRDFVSHLLVEGGGTLRYTLEVGTNNSGHTWATRMYTFVTEINHRRKEYVLCVYMIPINVVESHAVPFAPNVSVTN